MIKKGVLRMTKDNNEFRQAVSKIINISWKIIFIGIIIVSSITVIFYFGYNIPKYWYSWTLSYLLGTMVNLFAFNLLKNNINTLTFDKNNIGKSTSNYLIRLLIYSFVLYIAFTNDKLNPYFV